MTLPQEPKIAAVVDVWVLFRGAFMLLTVLGWFIAGMSSSNPCAGCIMTEKTVSRLQFRNIIVSFLSMHSFISKYVI
jgi:hypothetical protein